MSTINKLKAGPESELTKLKAVWRGLSDDARSYWSELFVSVTSQAEIRKQLLARLKINLRFDKQLNQFRSWVTDQEKRDNQAERLVENESRLQTEHPDWSLEQIRDEVLKQSYLETLSSGDFDLGMKTIRSDVRVKALALAREKFEVDSITLFLKWRKDRKMEELAESDMSNADKIAAMRKEAFKSVDALQASGKVVIPK